MNQARGLVDADQRGNDVLFGGVEVQGSPVGGPSGAGVADRRPGAALVEAELLFWVAVDALDFRAFRRRVGVTRVVSLECVILG